MLYKKDILEILWSQVLMEGEEGIKNYFSIFVNLEAAMETELDFLQ